MSSPVDFLDYFQGNHVYCVINDTKPDQIPKHLHEGFDQTREQLISKLRAFNLSKNGIFFCVNEIDRSLDPGKQRTSKMLKRIRAIWADDDVPRDEPRSDWPIPPNIIVETSKGKFHYYWLTTTDNLEQWSYVMNGVANRFGTDQNAKDLVRVLRIPGFFHKKQKPFQSVCYLGNKAPYPWNEITTAFPPDEAVAPAKSEGKNTAATFSSYDDAREAIITGTNFHGAIMWMLNHWVNNGMKSREELKNMIMDVLNSSNAKDDRWKARTNPEYLENNINDALNFVKENPVSGDENIEIEEAQYEIRQLDIGWPPGLMGNLCSEIYEMAPHPNEEVSLMGAFALVAGIVGRRHNVLGTGLNLYVTLLADTGIGKANLKNSINRALLNTCAMQGGVSFKGATRFTGPKSLFQMLTNGLSRVCVLEESGLMSESRAGDQIGLTRVMLDIFSSSGQGEFAGGEVYSNTDDDIQIIPSPALTIANVSTPQSYLNALRAKNAVVSGDIARIWLIRSHREKKYLNTKRRTEFTDGVSKSLRTLVGECIKHQQMESTANVVDIDTSEIDISVESNYWTDLENKYGHEGDDLRRSMVSRAFVKIMKIASIASIFNGSIKIKREEFKWAKEAIEGEIGVIHDSVTHGVSDDMLQIIQSVVYPIVTKILNFKYRSAKQNPPQKLKGKGIFTLTNLNQTLKNNEVIKRLNDAPDRQNPRTGVEKVISYMLRANFITEVDTHKLMLSGVRARVAFRITDDFKLLGEDI